MRPLICTHAMEVARQREAIRPNKTQRGLAAALLQAPPDSSADMLLAAPEAGGEQLHVGSADGSDDAGRFAEAKSCATAESDGLAVAKSEAMDGCTRAH